MIDSRSLSLPPSRCKSPRIISTTRNTYIRSPGIAVIISEICWSFLATPHHPDAVAKHLRRDHLQCVRNAVLDRRLQLAAHFLAESTSHPPSLTHLFRLDSDRPVSASVSSCPNRSIPNRPHSSRTLFSS